MSDNEKALSQIATAITAAQIMDKAANSGIPMNEIVIVKRKGRNECVTQKEKQASDQLKRKLLIENLKKRSIRGDNSLADDVQKRIRRCQELIEQIADISSADEKSILSIQRNLESTYNRSTSLVNEIQILESAIERKKNEDPVIVEFEAKTREMLNALHEKKFHEIPDLRNFCEQNKNLYNLRKKRLKPYMIKAKEAGLKFLIEKRRLMRIQFQIYNQITELYAKDIAEGKYNFIKSDQINQMVEKIHLLREIRSKSQDLIQKLSSQLRNVAVSFFDDIQKEIDIIDECFIQPMDQQVSDLIKILETAFQDNLSKQQIVKQTPKKRMAYQEKEENK